MEERNAAGALASPLLADAALIDPNLLMQMSAPSQPDYGTQSIALFGSDAPVSGPMYSTPDSVAPVTGPASPAAVPMTGPTMTMPQGPTANQDLFAGMTGSTFADPLGTDPFGDASQPTGPSMPGPSGGGGGGGAASNMSMSGPSGPTSYSGPSGPTGYSGPTSSSGPSGPTSFSGPSGPSGPTSVSGPSGPSGPTAPPTWVNGGPSFSWSAPSAPAVSAIGTQANAEGDVVSLQVQAVSTNFTAPSSPYRASLSYDAVGLPPGLHIDHTTGLISGTVDYQAAEAFGGAYKPTVVVADSVGGQSAQTFAWNVIDTVRPPTFTSTIGNQTSDIGQSVMLQANAAQPDGDQLIYDDNASLPSGLTIDSLSGAISGTIADDAASSYNVTLTATDNIQPDDPLTVSQSFIWTVNTLHDPSLTVPLMQTNAVGDAVSVQVTGNDAPGNTLTYSAVNLPDGLHVDAGSGLISGTIQNDAASDTPYAVTATLSDGTYQASQTLSWTVNYVGVANPGDQSNTVGDAVSLPVPNAPDLALTYSAADLPPGLSIASDSGTISGTIAATADTGWPYDVTVSATDGLHSASTSFSWYVAAWAPADRSDVEGSTVSFAGAAPSANSGLTYSATGLPAGVGIDSGTGVISGTITEGDGVPGPYTVSVATTYGGAYSTTQTFTWTITPAVDVPPTLAAPGDQTGVAGTPVSLALSATDSDGTDPTYSATGLPDGLDLDEYSGIISGAPAEDAIQSAPYVVTVTADDGNGGTAAQTVDWTVNDSTMSIQGNAISQVAGAGVDTFQVATFTDPDLNRQAGDYASMINWGDGQTSQGTVDGANGTYTVSGDHVYLHPGGLPLQVTVTDPAGGTATAVETASVAPAPLIATGNFLDGATAGAATAFTVATFTDANGYAAADSFTATINWGDGTATMAGVIDGSDGAFRVTGGHTYANDGTYTVGVTITDADGLTATTTSLVTAGDLQAGLSNTLTVAAFTSADPNATANSFSAIINWGDSGLMLGTSGTVLEEGGQFVVTAPHAYAAAGVYTIQVTVRDGAGDTISASEVRQVAPAPVGTAEGAVAAENGYLMHQPWALFALPSGSGSYTATADWGDGTSSAVSLYNNGGIQEAVDGHDYTGPGQYAVRTLVYNAALQLVAVAVSKVEMDESVRWGGPVVVPGNSIYRYVVPISPTAADKIKADFPSTTDGFSVTAGASRVRSGYHQNAMGEYDYFWADIQFDNKPAVVEITLAKWLQGQTGAAATLPVTVVQVKVEEQVIGQAPFKAIPAMPFVAKTVKPDMTIDGNPSNGNTSDVIASANFPRKTALKFQAEVYLKGPSDGPTDTRGVKGVSHITVGFVQYWTMKSWQVHFPSAMKSLVAVLDKKRYLDVAAGQPGPFYDNSEDALATGKDAVAGLVITASDTPQVPVPVIVNGDKAKEINAVWSFTLNVAAATNDTALGANLLRATEATAAPWTFNASGILAGDMSYTPAAGAGTKAPDPNQWTIVTAPAMEDVSGPVFNTAPVLWISKPDPAP